MKFEEVGSEPWDEDSKVVEFGAGEEYGRDESVITFSQSPLAVSLSSMFMYAVSFPRPHIIESLAKSLTEDELIA